MALRLDTEDLDPAVIAMLYSWGRIAGVSYSGPQFSAYLYPY